MSNLLAHNSFTATGITTEAIDFRDLMIKKLQNHHHRANNDDEINESNLSLETFINLIITDVQNHHYGTSREEERRLRVALEQAIINAFQHGNQQNPRAPIDITYQLDTDGHCSMTVTDQGSGFNRQSVPFPAPDEASGRGLIIMELFMDNVTYHNGTVTMSKQLRPDPHPTKCACKQPPPKKPVLSAKLQPCSHSPSSYNLIHK